MSNVYFAKSAKPVVLMLTCVLTWFATKQISAQFPAKRTPKKAVVRPARPFIPVGKSVATKEQLAYLEQIKPQGRGAISFTSKKSFTLTPLPGAVRVAADVNLYETTPGLNYFWSLQVLAADKSVLIPRHVFLDRPVEMVLGQQFAPAIEQTIPLPPGDYFVEYAIHRVGSEDKPEELVNEEFARETDCLSWRKAVSITQ